MLIKIVSVSIEKIKKGKADYSKATVIYTFNGQARTQNIISFANPAIFSKVQEWEVALPEGEVDVQVGKNDQGYNEWRSIGDASGAESPDTTKVNAPGAMPRSSTYQAPTRDFEGREERAARQVLIVKQSSLTAALKYHELLDQGIEADNVLLTAQKFADWVFENGNNND